MKKLLILMTIVGLFALTGCGGESESEITEVPALTEISESEKVADDRLQAYVNERGEGIIGGFEAREMTDFATVSVAGDDAVLISITLEDEFVETMAVTLNFLLATLEEEIESVMHIFSGEAGNVATDLGIDNFHFIIQFLLSTGDALAWQSIYADEVLGEFMVDLSFLDVETPEASQTTDGDRTTIEFDGVTVSLEEPMVMTSDEFKAEYPDWQFDLGTHYRWLLVYAEITNDTDQSIEFGNRPFYITDEFEELEWQSTAIDNLNGTGFDINGIIAPGEKFNGYVPFVVTHLSSTFEIDVRPSIVDELNSPFSGRFIFNFDVEMD